MGLARDIIDQAQSLVTQRQDLERTWERIANLLFMHPDRWFRRGSISTNRDSLEGWAAGSRVAERARHVYDITGVVAMERLTTGLLSLVTPDNEKWQSLKNDDGMGAVFDQEQEVWAERTRDYLFSVRYDPRSGWSLANQAAIRSAASIGTGAYIVEESFGENGASEVQVPYSCTNLPMSDNYLTVNGQGFHDQDFRFMTMSYRAAAITFKGMLSPKAMQMAKDPQQQNRQIQLLHYIGQREEFGLKRDQNGMTCHHGVHRQQAERRRAINQYEIEVQILNPRLAQGIMQQKASFLI